MKLEEIAEILGVTENAQLEKTREKPQKTRERRRRISIEF